MRMKLSFNMIQYTIQNLRESNFNMNSKAIKCRPTAHCSMGILNDLSSLVNRFLTSKLCCTLQSSRGLIEILGSDMLSCHKLFLKPPMFVNHLRRKFLLFRTFFVFYQQDEQRFHVMVRIFRELVFPSSQLFQKVYSQTVIHFSLDKTM